MGAIHQTNMGSSLTKQQLTVALTNLGAYAIGRLRNGGLRYRGHVNDIQVLIDVTRSPGGKFKLVYYAEDCDC